MRSQDGFVLHFQMSTWLRIPSVVLESAWGRSALDANDTDVINYIFTGVVFSEGLCVCLFQVTRLIGPLDLCNFEME